MGDMGNSANLFEGNLNERENPGFYGLEFK
jgi:hypothetical protein